MTQPLVSATWLRDHLDDLDIILLDASATFDPKNTIKAAVHFDIKNVFSDNQNPLPNAFPAGKQFENECRSIGINITSHIIVFDDKGIFTSPRVWWMFKAMGHDKISVLNGGLPRWQSLGFSTGSLLATTTRKGTFKVNLRKEAIISYVQILENINTQAFQVIDARSMSRFKGISPEPRPHIKSGHITNAINLPYTEVLDRDVFKSTEELKIIFQDLQLSDQPLVFTCGSGITACIVLLAHHLVSGKMASVYDGSWTEWAEKNRLFT